MFIGRPESFDRNRGSATVKPAAIYRPDGELLPGVHIRQRSSTAWIVMPEAEAIALANRIIDVIEIQTQRAESKAMDYAK